MQDRSTHSVFLGYVIWIFGVIGAHRFYFGKPISGTLYFFTLGFFFIGWIIDLFLIPSMHEEANTRFAVGECDYSVTWLLLTFTGLFGLHRLYMGKWLTAILYFFTGGLFLIGLLYDFWTMNRQVDELNRGLING
jgi:TM2 domain-containing membrane protein YozV